MNRACRAIATLRDVSAGTCYFTETQGAEHYLQLCDLMDVSIREGMIRSWIVTFL